MNKQWMGLCTLLIAAMMTSGVYAGDNLFANGDLEASTKKEGSPDYWGINAEKGITWETEGENHYLRLTCKDPGKITLAYREFRFKPDQIGKSMTMTFKMRCNGVEKGEKSWFTGTLFIQFMDKGGKKMKADIKGVPRMDGTHDQWEEKTVELVIPEGVDKLQVMPVLFNVKAGTLDFDDFTMKIAE